jgi:hypothetical protein
MKHPTYPFRFVLQPQQSDLIVTHGPAPFEKLLEDA